MDEAERQILAATAAVSPTARSATRIKAARDTRHVQMRLTIG
jgi:hypothetical protein